MKILMIANFVCLPWENGNSRFTYLLDNINCKKNIVELITSNFDHTSKKHRIIDKKNIESIQYKLTFIEEPGYKKNVSLKRFYSHYKLSRNLLKYLNTIDKPDVIYCAVPSLDVAKITSKYAKKNNIRLIIDVQDLWPEAFKMVFNIPIISNFIFWPMKKKANYIYKSADDIIAVSDTYVNRALLANKNINKGTSVYLGTDIDYFDECVEKNIIVYNDDYIRIAYIGTLGHSYNIKIIIDAIKTLNDKGINNIKFVVMGDGPLKDDFENYAKKMGITCEFTGRLKYEKMVGLLSSCDIAVNPISEKSVASIINKVGDYAAAGLPVINTQNSDEYKNLVDKYQIGFNCMNNDANSIATKLESLIKDKKLREKFGKNNRKLAEEKFDREKTYLDIIKVIER